VHRDGRAFNFSGASGHGHTLLPQGADLMEFLKLLKSFHKIHYILPSESSTSANDGKKLYTRLNQLTLSAGHTENRSNADLSTIAIGKKNLCPKCLFFGVLIIPSLMCVLLS